MIILFVLWNVYECGYDIMTVNMSIFSFTVTHTAGFSHLTWLPLAGTPGFMVKYLLNA